MGLGELFVYHLVPIEQANLPTPVPGFFVPKEFKKAELKAPYGACYLGPKVGIDSYQYTDFLRCQHSREASQEKYLFSMKLGFQESPSPETPGQPVL